MIGIANHGRFQPATGSVSGTIAYSGTYSTYTSGIYTVYELTSTGTLTVSGGSIDISYLVGGGGGNGSAGTQNIGGGGGGNGGGIESGSSTLTPTTYSTTIGGVSQTSSFNAISAAGGTSAAYVPSRSSPGPNGTGASGSGKAGVYSDITGTGYYYGGAGGGGGGSGSAGGATGGGAGAANYGQPGVAGSFYCAGGGGGSGSSGGGTGAGGAGVGGIVIVRYIT